MNVSLAFVHSGETLAKIEVEFGANGFNVGSDARVSDKEHVSIVIDSREDFGEIGSFIEDVLD